MLVASVEWRSFTPASRVRTGRRKVPRLKVYVTPSGAPFGVFSRQLRFLYANRRLFQGHCAPAGAGQCERPDAGGVCAASSGHRRSYPLCRTGTPRGITTGEPVRETIFCHASKPGVRNRRKKKYNHNIERLWEAHQNVFGKTAIKGLSKPNLLQSELWQNRPIEQFISKINKMGHPDGRYGLVSYSTSSDDIFKLDQIVFELRRRTIGLKWIIGEDWNVEQEIENLNGLPYRKAIEDFPTYQIRLIASPQYSVTAAGTEMSDILHAWNFAFLREKTEYEKLAPASVSSSIGAFSKSYLFLLFEALEKTAVTPEAIDRVGWLIDSIKLGRDIENALRRILDGAENTNLKWCGR